MQGGSHALAIVNSQGTVGVSGHTLTNDANNYANLSLQPYHIPNIQYVQNYVASTYNPGSGQGYAVVSELAWPLTGVNRGADATVVVTGTSGSTGQIQFSVNNTQQGYFSNAGLNVGNITTTYVTSSTNNIEVNSVVSLDNQSTPTYSAGTTKLYSSATIGPGRTGLYITNSTVQTPDELISRNRAVLLSILL
jgi:hypothetical protein